MDETPKERAARLNRERQAKWRKYHLAEAQRRAKMGMRATRAWRAIEGRIRVVEAIPIPKAKAS